MDMKASLRDSVCASDFYHKLVALIHLENTKNVFITFITFSLLPAGAGWQHPLLIQSYSNILCITVTIW